MKKFLTSFLLLFVVGTISLFGQDYGWYGTPQDDAYFCGKEYSLGFWTALNHDNLKIVASNQDTTIELGTKELSQTIDGNKYHASISFAKELVGEWTISAYIGSEGVWNETNTDFTTTFSLTSGTFAPIQKIVYRNTDYKTREYGVVAEFNTEQLPQQFRYAYKIGDGNWRWVTDNEIPQGRKVKEFTIPKDSEGSTIYFKYTYYDIYLPSICEYSVEIMPDSSYLEFPKSGGESFANGTIGTPTTFDWRKSNSYYSQAKLSIYLNEELVIEHIARFDDLYRYIPEANGTYKLKLEVGTGTDFYLSKTVKWFVGDPCELEINRLKGIIEEKEIKIVGLKDSITFLNEYITGLSAENEELRIIIKELKDELEAATKDTLITLQINGEPTGVVEVNYNTITIIESADEFVEVTAPINSEVWVFDILGNFYKADKIVNEITKYYVGDLSTGTYLIYVKFEEDYKLYKFIK